jgi:hypothetical protein
MEQEEKKISKFSSGINILQRVDFLWKNCHNFKRNGQYSKWNEELDSVWLELARDLKPEEYYDLDKDKGVIFDSEKNKNKIETIGYKSKFDVFEEKLKSLMPFADSGNLGFQQPTKDMKEKRNKQYKLLMEKQLFLARLENELGKGTSWEDEDEDF